MAILKTVRRTEKLVLKKPSFVPLFNYDAHVQAYRDHMIANFTGKVTSLKTEGKPLSCQKWYQPDYRSATPKGMVLKSAAVRGLNARWSVN